MGVGVHKDNMQLWFATATLPTVTGDGKWYIFFIQTRDQLQCSRVDVLRYPLASRNLGHVWHLQALSTKLQVSSVIVNFLIWFIADHCPT